MGKWDLLTQIGGATVAYNDLMLLSDQSQADGTQDRNVTASNLAYAVQKFIVSQTAHGLTVGECVRHNGTNYVEATADTAANAEVIGLVVQVVDVDTIVIQQAGFTDTQSGLTAGEYYYLQDAGGLGTTAGTVAVPVLLATSTTAGWVLTLGSAAGAANTDELVSVSANDTTPGYLNGKLVAGTGVTLTEGSDGANETLTVAAVNNGDMTKATYDTNDDGAVDSADVAERVEETSSTTASSGTTETLDLSTASVFNVTLTDNCTFTFSNSPTDSFGFTLILNQDGTGNHTATWPAAVEWAGGSAPTLTTTASATDVLTFITDDGGTTWYGFSAGLDFS